MTGHDGRTDQDGRLDRYPWLSRWRAVSRNRLWLALVVLALIVLVQGALLLRGWLTADGGDATATAGEPLGTSATTPYGAAAGTAGAGGDLDVRTDPPGATVTVDGVERGAAPLTVSDLAPGEHDVTIRAPAGTVRQTIHVVPGRTTALVVPFAVAVKPSPPKAAPSGAPAAGTLLVRAPFEVRIFEGERLVGTSEMREVRLSAGSHRLTLKNDDLGFEQTRTVTVSRGGTTSLAVVPPSGRVAINAVPWAEAWVGGKKVGETPIGALRLPLGTHVIALRHPTLGEKSVEITVKANDTARVSVDLRK